MKAHSKIKDLGNNQHRCKWDDNFADSHYKRTNNVLL